MGVAVAVVHQIRTWWRESGGVKPTGRRVESSEVLPPLAVHCSAFQFIDMRSKGLGHNANSVFKGPYPKHMTLNTMLAKGSR